MRHVAVVLAALALVAGSAHWLQQQAPRRPAAVTGVAVRASPGAFFDTTLDGLRGRTVSPPAQPCAAHGLGRGPVAAELLDITSRLPDALWRWRVSDHYAGPVLVRGVGPAGSVVAFQVQAGQIFAGESGEPLPGGGFPELLLTAPEYRFVAGAVSAWVEVRFPTPGCYALQADGLGFEQRAVLEVG